MVRLSSLELKIIRILKNVHKLKSFYHSVSTLKVFVSHNRTRKQQDENKFLRDWLRERKKIAEKEYSLDVEEFSLHGVIPHRTQTPLLQDRPQLHKPLNHKLLNPATVALPLR